MHIELQGIMYLGYQAVSFVERSIILVCIWESPLSEALLK